MLKLPQGKEAQRGKAAAERSAEFIPQHLEIGIAQMKDVAAAE